MSRLKLLLVGDSAVGKSTLISQFINNGQSFSSHHIATLGCEADRVETRAKEVVIKGETVVLQVWDTAGVERFAVLTKSFFRNAEGVMLAFDVSSRQSFESQFHTETSFWLQQVMENAKENTKKMLIATKADLEWAVSLMEAQRLADQYSMPFLITSALTNSNVQEAFC